jgi:Integrase core domain
LALLIVPSLIGQLLLGAELTGIGVTVARVTGIAVIALGIACWPGTLLVGMLIYNAGVIVYLAYVGLSGGLAGTPRGSPSQVSRRTMRGSCRRRECLSLHWFLGLEDLERTLEKWRDDYNHRRPHSSLADVPPAEFRTGLCCASDRSQLDFSPA